MASTKENGSYWWVDEFKPGNCRRVLHLSDLHFTSDTTPETYLQWLATDLKSLEFEELDAVVISGDFADKGDLGGFDRAKEFIKALCKRFAVDVKKRCLIVPGNHDVQDLDEAYEYTRKEPVGLPDGHVYEEGRGWLVRSETEHCKRLEPFSKKLHKPLFGRNYPLDPKKQGFVKTQKTFDGGWQAWANWPGRDPDGRYGYFDIHFK